MEAPVRDDYQIACEADSQSMEGMRKLAVVRLTRRGETTAEVFSLVSDEGSHLGGDGSAPTPLMYSSRVWRSDYRPSSRGARET